MVSATILRKIEAILRESSDPNLRRVLFEGKPCFNEIVRLLAEQIGDDYFTPRYLLPGKSGAKVLLLVRAPRRVNSVIKLATCAEIEKERTNYERWVRGRLDPSVYPELSPQSATTETYSCLEYTWAGGTGPAVSLRSFLTDQKPATKDVLQVLRILFNLLPGWHQAFTQKEHREDGAGGCPTVHPFEVFRWNEESIPDITKAIVSFAPHGINTAPLIDIVNGGRELKSRLSAPTRIDNASIATISHGDLNSNNVLVLRDSLGYRPMLIDFASIEVDKFCPARDWTRLARDSKFIVLSQLVKGNAPSFDTLLGAIDEQRQTELPEDITPCVHALRFIEDNYVMTYGHASTCSELEYAYHLLCWNLAFLDTEEFKGLSTDMKSAVLRSALRTLTRVENVAKGARERSLIFPVASTPNDGVDTKLPLVTSVPPAARNKGQQNKVFIMIAAVLMLVALWIWYGIRPRKIEIHQSSHDRSSPNIVNDKGGKVTIQIDAAPNSSSTTEKPTKREPK